MIAHKLLYTPVPRTLIPVPSKSARKRSKLNSLICFPWPMIASEAHAQFIATRSLGPLAPDPSINKVPVNATLIVAS